MEIQRTKMPNHLMIIQYYHTNRALEPHSATGYRGWAAFPSKLLVIQLSTFNSIQLLKLNQNPPVWLHLCLISLNLAATQDGSHFYSRCRLPPGQKWPATSLALFWFWASPQMAWWAAGCAVRNDQEMPLCAVCILIRYENRQVHYLPERSLCSADLIRHPQWDADHGGERQ